MRLHLLFVAVMVLFFQGCQNNSTENETMVSEAHFTLQDTTQAPLNVTKKGADFIFEGVQEPLVLVNVFATWCPSCQQEFPHLGNLQRKYSGKLALIALSIDTDKSNDDLEAFRRERHGEGIRITNKADNPNLAMALASTIGAGDNFPIPMMILFKNGRYVTSYVGATPEEMIDQDIAHALGAQ